MTFHYTDPDGDHLQVDADERDDGTPVLYFDIEGVSVHIPLDRVEELVTGIRDTAREAAAYANSTSGESSR